MRDVDNRHVISEWEWFTHIPSVFGLGVSNQKNSKPQKDPQWIELELDFEPWSDV